MGGFFWSIFGGDRRSTSAHASAQCQSLPEPIHTDVNRCELVETDGLRLATPCPFPTRRWVEPAEHAEAILEFLQGPGGRTGSLPVEELQQLHLEICAERDWELIGWTAVGRELRELLKADKTYEPINGRRTRVYRIPPLAARRGQIKIASGR
jgi:hypothetical protein